MDFPVKSIHNIKGVYEGVGVCLLCWNDTSKKISWCHVSSRRQRGTYHCFKWFLWKPLVQVSLLCSNINQQLIFCHWTDKMDFGKHGLKQIWKFLWKTLKMAWSLREGFKKKKVRNFPHFSGVGGFEKVIFRKKKYGLKMHKIT